MWTSEGYYGLIVCLAVCACGCKSESESAVDEWSEC